MRTLLFLNPIHATTTHTIGLPYTYYTHFKHVVYSYLTKNGDTKLVHAMILPHININDSDLIYTSALASL